jgi:cell division GTPase FtsZ
VIDADAKYKWGMSIDPSYGDEVKVTIIATGFQEQAPEKIKKSESSSFMNNIDKPLQKISTNNP